MPAETGSILQVLGKLISSPKLIYLVSRIIVFGAAIYGSLFGRFILEFNVQFAFNTILSLALGGVAAEYLPVLYRYAKSLDNWLRLFFQHVTLEHEHKTLVGRALRFDRRHITTDLASGFALRDRLPSADFQIFLQKGLGKINNGIFSFELDYWRWLNKRRLHLIRLSGEKDKKKSVELYK